MFFVENNDITITKGDSGHFLVKLENGDGTEFVPSGSDVVRFSVKHKKEGYYPVILEKTGEKIVLDAKDTQNVKSGEYVYDIAVEKATGERYTAVEGKFIVRKAVHEFE
ncbi:MAG: hypothetical protein IJ297_07615 [Clostridia bacterium]|nr:hypothetical protein [Clostridia bacterium]